MTKCWNLVLTSSMAYVSARSLWWFTFLPRPSFGVAPGSWLTPPSTPGTWRCMLTEKAGSTPSLFPFTASGDPLAIGFLPENIITGRTLFASVHSQRTPRSEKWTFQIVWVGMRRKPGWSQALSVWSPTPDSFTVKFSLPGTPNSEWFSLPFCCLDMPTHYLSQVCDRGSLKQIGVEGQNC